MTERDNFAEGWAEDTGQAPTYEWAICGYCRGHGGSTAYLGSYTQSDREEMGEEWYEFAEDVRLGHYDRPCGECGGSGKVKEFNGDAAEQWAEWQREAAADRQTQRMESGQW